MKSYKANDCDDNGFKDNKKPMMKERKQSSKSYVHSPKYNSPKYRQQDAEYNVNNIQSENNNQVSTNTAIAKLDNGECEDNARRILSSHADCNKYALDENINEEDQQLLKDTDKCKAAETKTSNKIDCKNHSYENSNNSQLFAKISSSTPDGPCCEVDNCNKGNILIHTLQIQQQSAPMNDRNVNVNIKDDGIYKYIDSSTKTTAAKRVPTNNDNKAARRPSGPQYALNNYDDNLEYSDEEDFTLLEKKSKLTGRATDERKYKNNNGAEGAVRESTPKYAFASGDNVCECDHESNEEDSQQSLTSLPQYAINIDEMDDDVDNLLNQKYQKFERPLPVDSFTGETLQDDITPTTNDNDNNIINMKLPGAIAIGADKKPRYRSQVSTISAYDDKDYNSVNSSNYSVDEQCNHSLDEGYTHEPVEAAQRGLTRKQSTKVALLVDEQLEIEALDRRVEEVLKSATIATAEEIDDNGRKRKIFCIVSIAFMFVIAAVVIVAITIRSKMVNLETQPTQSPTNTQKPTLQTVKERGVLKCGVQSRMPGLSDINKITGQLEGFEIHLCRAIAAAVMGANYSIEAIELNWAERFVALANMSVDVLAYGTVHTMESDVHQSDAKTGFSFSVPYLYDGLGFGGMPTFVDCAEQLQAYGACSQLKICVAEGSSHYDILKGLFPNKALITTSDSGHSREKFINGDCNVIATGRNNLSKQFLQPKTMLDKEPLAIVTRDNDHEWSQTVNWVPQALFLAESMDITKDTAADFSKMSPYGDKYNEMFINALSAVGNYGQLYERYIETIVHREGLNMLYLNEQPLNDEGRNNGLIYSHPFGAIDSKGPNLVVGSKLSQITERGLLQCGVTEIRDGFAMFDTESKKWKGFDIDYCNAIAAAIFGGLYRETTVEYIDLTNQSTFDALITDVAVDVVCGVNIDIEANIEMGISFSQPYFYEGRLKSRSLATYEENDSQFSDFVWWVVSSTFYAEEQNITSSSIFNAMPEVRIFGPKQYDMLRHAILVSGNYGDIYERNLHSIIPRSGRNNLNSNLMKGPQINPYVGLKK